MTAHTRFLLRLCEVYRAEAGIAEGRTIPESTISLRLFKGDSEKIADMRGGADLTSERFEAAVRWALANWPPGRPMPRALKRAVVDPQDWESEIEVDAARARTTAAPVAVKEKTPRKVKPMIQHLQELAAEGYTTREAATEVGRHYDTVRRAADRHGIRFQAERRPRSTTSLLRTHGEAAE